MKIAILSDIHGNNAALSEVLRSIDRQGISSLFVLGDQLGYYLQAEEVYKELSRYGNCMIQGNHER
ncbi:MAG: metallophosphoesterase, partial [Cytophagales bacterium]|nr:metallophosphoesterase [Cytophagales bacterium]